MQIISALVTTLHKCSCTCIQHKQR